jgi:copper(I)-binding protein
MTRLILPFATLMLLAACSKPSPPLVPVPMLEFHDAWARATAPGHKSGAMYVTIVNRGEADDRLVGVTASRAAMATVHATETLDGVARMRMVRELPIPANATVALSPGGTHVMLDGMTAPLSVGDEVELTLRFEKAGTKRVAVKVNAPAAR